MSNLNKYLRGNRHISKSSDRPTLKNYLDEKLQECRLSEHVLKQFLQSQRERIDEMNITFWIMKNNRRIGQSIFIAAKIENVISPRDFYAIQVCHSDVRNEFQNILNQTYENDCEPIDELKVKDNCVVFDNMNWCRAEVVEFVMDCTGKQRIIVYLIDYGLTIRTKMKKLCMLKKPHDSIIPFVVKCQLSVLNTDESELIGAIKYTLSKEFERFSKTKPEVSLFLNGPSSVEADSYDVILLAHEYHTSTYLIHEVYGAFSCSKMLFDNEICANWSDHIPQIAIKCSSDYTQKIRVEISHIVSPTEIYIKCRAAEAFMHKIREKIDAYVKIHRTDDHTEWSTGQDCFVRLQNWKTESYLMQWYRGRIVNEDSNKGTFIVFLRDYGRKFEVLSIDLMPMPFQFSAPQNAVECCSLNISNSWSNSSTEILLNICKEFKYFAISCTSKSKSCLNIALWATNSTPDINNFEIWDNIGLSVISQSIVESMETFIKKSQRHYDKNKYRCTEIYDYSFDSDVSSYIEEYDFFNNVYNTICFDGENNGHYCDNADNGEGDGELPLMELTPTKKWNPPIPIDSITVYGYVTHITSSGIIYFQEESKSDIACELMQSISHHIKIVGYKEQRKHIWNEGEICFAMNDFNYFRAVIKKINREDGTALIYYVDYGSKAVLKFNDLYPATGFGKIPILVNRFYVSRFVPNGRGKWSSVVMDEFRCKLVNKMCIVCMDYSAENKYFSNDILPCSIEPRVLPCDMYKWIKAKKLAFGTCLNSNDEECLFV